MTRYPPLLAHPYPDQPEGWPDGPSKGTHFIRLWHIETRQPIRSWFIFKVTTTDPENQPLPSFELLSLRWNLSRIAAMQGEIEEEEEEEEDTYVYSDEDSVTVTLDVSDC